MDGAIQTADPKSPAPRLLVVDDEPDNLDLLCRLFRRGGCEVFPAVNGTEALRLAREVKPDLVVLDVMLPDINGREVCRRIKANPALVDVFIALISSIETSPDSKVAGLECGADDYIARPIANKELVARVDVLIRIQRALTARRLAEERLAQLNLTLEQRVIERTRELATANEQLRAEIVAREASEARFAAFMEHSPAFAWIKDERFRYVYLNPRVCRFLKRTLAGVVSRTDYELFPRPVARQIRLHDRAVLERGVVVDVTENLADGDSKPCHCWTLRFPLVDAAGRRYVAGMAVDVTEKVRAEEALRALPHQIMAAQETERRRVARELHDGVSQLLASVRFRLQTVEGRLPDRADRQLRTEVTKAKNYLGSALQEVRSISHNLRPRELDDFGLVAALGSAADEMREHAGLRVECHLERLRKRLPPETELAIYRIFQEAVANVFKHAAAKTIEIRLAREANGVSLSVSDDGRGFVTGARRRDNAARSSLGMVNMRERAEFIGGSLVVKSVPGEGTTIQVWAPVALRGKDRRKP
ncbi:MAG: response regulator [Proteobacteria bacterium]|nr:response regulator [Pseudomonadota bacterium]